MYKSNSHNYKDNAVSKYVGNKFGSKFMNKIKIVDKKFKILLFYLFLDSKKFTKFLENNEKIFLFQSMISKIPDPLEKSRDKSVI